MTAEVSPLRPTDDPDGWDEDAWMYAGQYEPRPGPRFLIDGMLPRGCTLISGGATVGKTSLVLWMMNALYRGTPVLGMEPLVDPSETIVCFSGSDSTWREEVQDTAQRLIGWGEDILGSADGKTPGRLIFHKGIETFGASHEKWAALRRRLRSAGVTVLVVDNLYSLLGDQSSVDSEKVVPILGQLTKINEDLGVAVILLHHSARGGVTGNKRGRGAGNMAIPRWARVELQIGGEPIDPTNLLTITGNKIATPREMTIVINHARCDLLGESTTTSAFMRKEARDHEAEQFWIEAPRSAKVSIAAAARWLVASDLFPTVHKEASGRSKIVRWSGSVGYLKKGRSGNLLAGPAMPKPRSGASDDAD